MCAEAEALALHEGLFPETTIHVQQPLAQSEENNVVEEVMGTQKYVCVRVHGPNQYVQFKGHEGSMCCV